MLIVLDAVDQEACRLLTRKVLDAKLGDLVRELAEQVALRELVLLSHLFLEDFAPEGEYLRGEEVAQLTPVHVRLLVFALSH